VNLKKANFYIFLGTHGYQTNNYLFVHLLIEVNVILLLLIRNIVANLLCEYICMFNQ